MAFNSSYNNYRGGQPRQQAGSWGNNRPAQPPARKIEPKKVPLDYTDKAEQIMQNYSRSITTSKLRNLLSLISDVYNQENLRTDTKILPESETKLNLMRIRTVYECGREQGGSLKEFVETAQILEYLKGIQGEREDLIRFAHYMEALVAYHRYYGGKEG